MTYLFSLFWQQKPALFLGIHLLIGVAFCYFPHPSYLFPLLILWIPFLLQKEKRSIPLQALVVLIAGFFYAQMRYPPTSLSEKRVSGIAYFSPSDLKPYQSPFQRSFVYSGMIQQFSDNKQSLSEALPCAIFFTGKNPPPANVDYILEGDLVERGFRNYLFKPKKHIPWVPVEGTWNLAQKRFELKEKVRAHLREEIKNPKTTAFLSSLITGDIDDRTLNLEMKKVGLQHLLAVSGFHFTLIALFLGGVLRLILPMRLCTLALIILLTLYFLFVGSSAPVTRGWIAATFLLIGKLFHLRTSGLNLLGLGIIIEILLDPLVILNIGFQLSFLCTLGILLLFQTIEEGATHFLPKRTLAEALALNRLDQHGYIASSVIRSLLSLNLSVHLISIPVLLFLFHKFPLISLLYNLFFPFCANISMLLLFLALLINPLHPLAHLIHSFNNTFTTFVLNLVEDTPALLNQSIHVRTVPYVAVIIALTVIVSGGIFLQMRRNLE